MNAPSTVSPFCAAVLAAIMTLAPSVMAGADEGGSAPHSHEAAAPHPAHEAAAARPTAAAPEARLREGASLIAGRQLYAERCSACHGPRGRGTPEAEVDFSDPSALVRLTREAIESRLTQDDEHGAALSLEPGERVAVTGYLRNYLMLPAPDADTEIGRAIYARSCSVCHGDRGDAASLARASFNPPPADFTAHSLSDISREEMIDAVYFGKDNTAMMPFRVQLSREEIIATVDYIRAAFLKEEGAESDAAAHAGHDHTGGHHAGGEASAAFPGGLTGDPVEGRALFNATCAECHGTTGDGKGPRAYFMLKKPRNFTGHDARTSLSRARLFERISKGTVGTTMPAWETVFSDQQIADVGEYVFQRFLNPEAFEQSAASGEGEAGADQKKN